MIARIFALLALLAVAVAFVPAAVPARSSALRAEEEKHKGVGGMADTRDPDAFTHEDPRKSISKAPTFEEYLKQRAAEQGK